METQLQNMTNTDSKHTCMSVQMINRLKAISECISNEELILPEIRIDLEGLNHLPLIIKTINKNRYSLTIVSDNSTFKIIPRPGEDELIWSPDNQLIDGKLYVKESITVKQNTEHSIIQIYWQMTEDEYAQIPQEMRMVQV